MTTASSIPSWLPFRCRDCGCEVGFRSRRRTLSERYILPLFLMQPVRCGECFRRDYRLIFTQVRDRPAEVSAMIPPPLPLGTETQVAPKRNIA